VVNQNEGSFENKKNRQIFSQFFRAKIFATHTRTHARTRIQVAGTFCFLRPALIPTSKPKKEV